MVTGSFRLARIPPVRFGAGRIAELPEAAAPFCRHGRRALLVTGASSLAASGRLERIREGLRKAGLDVLAVSAEGEPTTAFIDGTCAELRGAGIEVVIGAGGGSVIDAAKALSAMLPHRNSVLDHLEDVGTGAPHSGVKVPFVAVPTTSGTGGEVTKNAVLSEVGPEGYKKSIRHDAFIPDAVIVDPELMLTCPPGVTAACGMDAFTQLLEPYLSPASNPAVDALAWSGLERIAANLLPACGDGAGDVEVRAGMAYASMMSGIALANAGLGIVHGLASPLGGWFPIPHGVVCGTLVAGATAANIAALRRLRENGPSGEGGEAGTGRLADAAARARAEAGLAKYARVGALLDGADGAAARAGFGPAGPADARETDRACDRLVDRLREWTEALGLPPLGAFGIREADLDRVAAAAGNRNNPVALDRGEIRAILAGRL
jgi:alcohol dehydrogenase